MSIVLTATPSCLLVVNLFFLCSSIKGLFICKDIYFIISQVMFTVLFIVCDFSFILYAYIHLLQAFFTILYMYDFIDHLSFFYSLQYNKTLRNYLSRLG